MAALPGTEWTEAPLHRVNSLGTVRHVFTHFSLDLHVAPASEPIGEGWWQPLETLDHAGLPTLFRKACELALRQEHRRAA
jgi:A/G-specific adenine glycosylase